jgi:decaprenyl-phosphate phosphoribosyltransferase
VNKIILIAKLIRPQQWIKNLFVYVPLFFAGQFFEIPKLITLFIGFVSFCMVSSAVYVLNDYRDIEADKIHPKKKYRPLASGAINSSLALGLMVVMAATGFGLSYFLSPMFSILLGSYAAINILYSFGLKKVSIIDLLIVAIGFVMRTIAGGIIAEVYVSHWLVIMIFLLALLLVVAKRREDMLEFVASGTVLRESIKNYNLEFINSILTMLSGVITVSYIMYTVSPEVIDRLGTHNLYMTSIFVIVGLMRYLQLTVVENKSGSPVRILYTDRFIHVTLVGWLAAFFLILYLR